MSKLSIQGAFAISLLTATLSFYAQADTDLDKNLQAIEAFSQRTESLLEASQNNGVAYSDLVEGIGDVLERTQSAKAAVSSIDLSKLSVIANDNAALGDKYIAEYRDFLGELDKNSACYTPNMVDEYQTEVSKLRDFADSVTDYASVSDEGEAYEAMMAISANSVLVAAVPSLFAIQNMCIAQDAAPVIEQFGEVEGAIVNALIGQAILNEEGEFDLPSEMLNGGEDDAFFEEDDGYDEDDSSPLISELTFLEPKIAECMKQSADASGVERVNGITMFICDLPKNAKVRLDDLAQFPYLDMVILSGGDIESLAPLTNATYLSQITVEDSTIQSFGDLSDMTASVVFSYVTASNWGSLAQSGLDYITIEQPHDCSELSPLLGSGAVTVEYVDDEQDTVSDEALETANLLVVTDCRQDSVF
ncbi:hypothetical protein [Grimontia sp. AD028]|uniref:hypothetical protein n=1 Tax=Grimontia sp. AD028 TaxID=1581149 RepID=UPI00061ACDD8|nr:hypothetical protein [Grimontia sp. AD028]